MSAIYAQARAQAPVVHSGWRARSSRGAIDTNARVVDERAVSELLQAQDGVVSRRQLLALEVTDSEIERKLRRREWARVHPGVYVEHTGPLTWLQRAWAAFSSTRRQPWPDRQRYVPRSSAATARRTPRRSGSVSTPRGRCEADQASPWSGSADWESSTQEHLSPPRQRLEHALVSAASAKAGEDAAVAQLADAVQQGRTTAGRLAAALEECPRLKHRRLLLEILRDVDAGAYSVLERHYLARVERPHGLPTGKRQRRVHQGKHPAFRDVDYVDLATVVELDGRLGHEEAADRWADLDRDLSAVVAGELTLRAGWGQVLEPCRLAGIVGGILIARGWISTLRGCSEACAGQRPRYKFGTWCRRSSSVVRPLLRTCAPGPGRSRPSRRRRTPWPRRGGRRARRRTA